MTYIYEANLGLSVARNRGAAAAKGSLLAYLDDDAEAAPHWLAALAEAFAQRGKKLNMGTACLRFKKLEDLPLDVVGAEIARYTVDGFIALYEASRGTA
ncbi:MAG: glycosyltransferase family 2 protein [Leptolyngbyaceae cyanobacterium SM2_3_12]|nr:glycosyltransferase family 2 protein [Leptolyngbyaceae cyanobacterium SM2_3_12]